MELCGAIGELAGEDDDFGDDELSDGAGVGEGGVEDGNAGAGSKGEVDGRSTDAEGANAEEVFSVLEDGGGETGFGTDAEDVDVSGCVMVSLVFYIRFVHSLD